jgi:hypothetical protein
MAQKTFIVTVSTKAVTENSDTQNSEYVPTEVQAAIDGGLEVSEFDTTPLSETTAIVVYLLETPES